MNRSSGSNVLTDIVVYSMLVAGLLVMTRPGSQGPPLVSAFTGGYSNIIKAATGQ
jgi:hypothetical protein